MYKVDPSRKDLVEEFRRTPVGHHSADLLMLLNFLRAAPLEGKHVLVCTKPHREWVLAQLSGGRGSPVRLLADQMFTSIEDAEWAVFKLRWKQHTGEDLD